MFHYNSLMYQALLRATKTSLNALKKRVCSKASIGFLFLERPFFEVDVKLAVPSVQLTPSLADIQRTVNKAALAVLRCSKSVWEWGQGDKPEPQRSSFFDRIGLDIEIVKVVLLLNQQLILLQLVTYGIMVQVLTHQNRQKLETTA